MNKFLSGIFQGDWEYEKSFLILFALAAVQYLEIILSRGNYPAVELLYFPVRFFLMFLPVLFFAVFLYRKILKGEFGVNFSYPVFLKKLFSACLKWLFLYFLFYFIIVLFFTIDGTVNFNLIFLNDFITELFFAEFLVSSIVLLILFFVSGVEMILLSVKNFRFLPIGIALAAISWYLIPIFLND